MSPAATARPATGAPRRPPEVLALVALLGGAALCVGVGVAFPMSDRAPVRLGAVMVAIATAMAVLTWVAGSRLPRWVLLAETVVAVVLNSVLVARAATPGGALADAFAYLWLTGYAAIFFPRSWAPFAALVATGFGAGLLAGELPRMMAPWLVLSLSTLTIAVVLSRISLLVQGRLGTDGLTGVLNRTGLHEAAERVVRRRRRREEALAVAALDLDGFKEINDRSGHATGDRLLVEAADAWRGALRCHDVLARTGGDEFVLLMPGTSTDEAQAVLARLRAAHPVAWSAGITAWRADEPLEACLERADRRLYAAKNAR
jgi:diguanylate cyclase (GGDEF)-like protein